MAGFVTSTGIRTSPVCEKHGKTGTLVFLRVFWIMGEKKTDLKMKFTTNTTGRSMVHHSMTIHRADGNTSESVRDRQWVFIYYANKAKKSV